MTNNKQQKSLSQLTRVWAICAVLALALAQTPKKAPEQAETKTKLKRDAGLSFGSIYHGPSHKYLPPPAPVRLSYEGGHHFSGGLHGNGLAANSGFDFGSLDTHSYQPQSQPHQHHYQVQHSQQAHHVPQRPVYSSGGGGGGGGSSYHHAPKVETFIVQSSSHGPGHGHVHAPIHTHAAPIGAAHTGYKYATHGSSSSSGNSFLNLLAAHKLHGSYIAPSSAYSHAAHGTGTGTGTSHGHGYHYAHAPELEQHLTTAPEESLSSGSTGAGGIGYSFEAAHKPLSSYGVPLLPGYAHGHRSEATSSYSHHDEQQPAYALGHKGLGHFSYTSSKPHALHTDILSHGPSSHGSSNQQHSYHHHQQIDSQEHNDISVELSKAPFKPSTFLGAKHESSSESHAGYDYATPSTQYLQPPTATGGYDYQAAAVLYGAPTHSGDAATPIFEPEATYLPPATASVPQLSYGPPAAASHGYHH